MIAILKILICLIPIYVIVKWTIRPIKGNILDMNKEPALHELAFMSGGPTRVLNTWWVELCRLGVVESVDNGEKEVWRTVDGKRQKVKIPIYNWMVNNDELVKIQDPYLKEAAEKLPKSQSFNFKDNASKWVSIITKARGEMEDNGYLTSTSEKCHKKIMGVWIALGITLFFIYNAVLPVVTIKGSFFLIAIYSVFTFGLIVSDIVPKATSMGRMTYLTMWKPKYELATRIPDKSNLSYAVALGGLAVLAVLASTPYNDYANGLIYMQARSDGGSGGGGCGSTGVSSDGSDSGGCSGGCGGGGCGGGGCGGGGCG